MERQGEIDGLGLILDGQAKKLQDCVSYIHHSITALKNSQGDSTIATAPTLPQLWSQYGVAPDMDAAKCYATGIHRHTVWSMSVILAPLEEILLQNIHHLQKLKNSIPADEPNKVEGGASYEDE